ncbi:ferritin [Paenisporosarcina antarctica]|uniref:Ferritin n=1 Tax=Paenisporosarcina antarctica TaxID=417367 RepID=A0A4P6ZWJ6_9BACL|nr:ferritin [Paenisporosarcina antarctica]QBP39856.1 ferritin [Paenisporosarcina antarctica]
MLPTKMTEALNKQFNNEMQAAHAYKAMATYFSDKGYQGFANFYLVQAKEEDFHAMKFYHFLVTMGEKPVLRKLEEPKNHFENAVNVVEESLAQERAVTTDIYTLATLAEELKQHSTKTFLDWFIKEQMEEEEAFRLILVKLNGIQEGGEFFLKMDEDFAQRTLE